MKSYTIQSGPLKVTIVAPSAYEAAVEAVRFWEVEGESSPEAAHRGNLDAVLEVRPRQSQRPARLFPTFNLLARTRGQSPSQAWEQVLRTRIAQSN